MAQTGNVPHRPFGRHHDTVSILGLGGYHLGSIGTEREAIQVVRAAIDGGITFMDNAWEYHEGASETRMGKALANGWREKVFLMTKVCTHGRDAKTAMRMLEESLRRLKTDHLDLWQVHEVAYWGDPERHFAKARSKAATAGSHCLAPACTAASSASPSAGGKARAASI